MRAVAALALVLIAAATAHAQPVATLVKVGQPRIGFHENEYQVYEGWLPISIPIENSGPDVEVKLVARVQRRDPGARERGFTAERTFVLSAQAKRREVLHVVVDRWDDRVIVEVHAANALLLSTARSFDVLAPATRDGAVRRLLLVKTGPRIERPLDWLTNADPGRMSAEHLEPAELPERLEGYSGIDLVALVETSGRDLDDARRRALLAWARNGGRILLVPGVDPAWFRDDLVRSLLPRDVEVAPHDVDAPYRLVNLARIPFDEPPRMRLYSIKTTEPAARIWEEPVPGRRVGLFTILPFDRGEVVVAGAPLDQPPLEQWNLTLQALGGELVKALAHRPLARTNVGEDAARLGEALNKVELPSPLLIVPIVVLYVLVVGPITHRILRRRDAHVLVIATTPVVSVAFAAVTFATGYFLRGMAMVAERATVVEVRSGDDSGLERTGYSLRAASSTTYDVVADPPLVAREVALRPGDQERRRANRVVESDGRFAFPGLALENWEHVFFEAHGIRPLGGAIAVDVENDVVVVTNRSSHRLAAGLVFSPRATGGFRVPALAPGEKATVSFETPASPEEPGRIVEMLAEDPALREFSARAFDGLSVALKTRTTYLARVVDPFPSIQVAGRGRAQRELCLVAVRTDDYPGRDADAVALAQQALKGAGDLETALAATGRVLPVSKLQREARALRERLENELVVRHARTLYDEGDLAGARRRIDELLARPDVDEGSKRVARERLARWTSVAAAFEEALAAAQERKLATAIKRFAFVNQHETDVRNRYRVLAADRQSLLVELEHDGANDWTEVQRRVTGDVEKRPSVRAWEARTWLEVHVAAADDRGQARDRARKLVQRHADALLKQAEAILDVRQPARAGEAREILELLLEFLPPEDRAARNARVLERRLARAEERK